MKKIFALSVLILLTSLIAKAQVPKESKNESAKPTMHKIFSHMQSLLPYMTSEEKFVDPKNEKIISTHLKQSSELVKNAKHISQLDSPALKISRQALETHFSEIERIYRLGNKSFARWQLNSTLPLCMSCHTQAPSLSRHWDLAELTKGASSEFDKAELLFMGRDFDSALKIYDKIISKYPENSVEIQKVEKSLERKVVIFSRVKRDFQAGIKNLEQSLKNKKLPEYLAKNIKAWTALFRIQIRDGFPDPVKSNDEAIQKYVTKELKNGLWDDMVNASNPRLVKNLTVSGVLYEYLNTHPKTKIKPDILNWLAVLDKQLQDTLFYSLSDLYLKECMSEFTTHPTAKKCFEEYKTNTILSYSGSGGVFLPDDVKKELKDWSLKIFGVDKSNPDE